MLRQPGKVKVAQEIKNNGVDLHLVSNLGEWICLQQSHFFQKRFSSHRQLFYEVLICASWSNIFFSTKIIL